MKRKMIAALLALTVFCAGLTACTQAKAADLTENVKANPMDVSNALTEPALDSMRAFSMELFRRSAAQKGENTLVSPTSVLLALGLTGNGARGNTLAAFESLLGGGQLTMPELNAACKALIGRYEQIGGGTTFHIANSIWYDEGFEAEPEFLQTDADFFGAPAFVTDFADPKTLEAVNGWIKEKTNGLIPKMLDEMNDETVMFLINALYLKTTWQSPFDPNDNYDGIFTLSDGTTKEVTLMSNGIAQEQYIKTGAEEGVLMPYDDGKLAFLAVMPEKGVSIADYAATFDQNALGALIAQAQSTRVLLRLPKFEAEFGIGLNDVLKDMGLETAFDPDNADFTGMGASSLGNLCIGSVLHKTCLAVNEKGTEAAAATVVGMETTAMPMDYEQLCFDRPFVYAVVDLETELPVFIGMMENPAA